MTPLREPPSSALVMVVDYPALLDLMRSRRSVRSFLPVPLDPLVLDKLVEAARWAPTAGNRQAFRLLAIESREALSRMGEAVAAAVERLRGSVRADLRAAAGRYLDNFLHFTHAPLVLAPIWRPGASLLGAALQSPPATEPADEEGLASVSAAIENLLLAAHALGLGACWMTGPLVAREELQRILGVPEGWRLAALVPVGRPAAEAPVPPRRDAGRLVQRLR